MRKVRYAIVGPGSISQEAFMPGVAQTGNSEMTAIVCGGHGKGEKLAEFYGIKHVYTYEQYDEFLQAGVADAVYIALPNSMHADYSVRASKAGLHSLVEKPMATTVEECEAMIAAAEAANVWILVGYRLHNEPATIETLEAIRRGDIGDPRMFSAGHAFSIEAGNHRLKGEHWGGALQDIGIYCLNAARHVFQSEPEAVLAVEGWGGGDRRFSQVPETVSVILLFPGGRIANFQASFGTAPVDYFRVAGSKGELALEPAFRFQDGRTLRLTIDEEARTRQYRLADNFSGMTAYFSECILNNQRPEADGHEGLADVAIMRAIEKAARSGEMQKISLPPKRHYPDQAMARPFPPAMRKMVL